MNMLINTTFPWPLKYGLSGDFIFCKSSRLQRLESAIQTNDYSQCSSDFFSWCIFHLVRFPFNPTHLLCIQQFYAFFSQIALIWIHHLNCMHISHNAPYLPSKILHNLWNWKRCLCKIWGGGGGQIRGIMGDMQMAYRVETWMHNKYMGFSGNLTFRLVLFC